VRQKIPRDETTEPWEPDSPSCRRTVRELSGGPPGLATPSAGSKESRSPASSSARHRFHQPDGCSPRHPSLASLGGGRLSCPPPGVGARESCDGVRRVIARADYVDRFLVSIGAAWKTRVDSRFGQFAANRGYDGRFQDLDDDELLNIVTRGSSSFLKQAGPAHQARPLELAGVEGAGDGVRRRRT
jgi:hypothetical protein